MDSITNLTKPPALETAHTAAELEALIWEQLKTIPDPELNIDIVSLGLIYQVEAKNQSDQQLQAKITMTLTTPGCPLAGVFDQLVRGSLPTLNNFDPQQDLQIVLTFDPPWVPDLMSEAAKMELGLA